MSYSPITILLLDCYFFSFPSLMPYSYLRHTSSHSLQLLPERHMKTTFPGSYFTKLLCKQNSSYDNRVPSFVFISLSLLAAELGLASHSATAQVGPEAHREVLLLHLLVWQQPWVAVFRLLARQVLALNQKSKISFCNDRERIISHFVKSDDIYPSHLTPADTDTNTAGKYKAKNYWSNRSCLCSGQSLFGGY